MNAFMRKWNNRSVEDMGTVMSKEAKEFVDDFAKMLERQLGGDGVRVDIHPNHYDCSGFLEKDGKFIFISYTMPRGERPIDFSDVSPLRGGVLFRAADGPHDYHGHINNYSSLQDLPRHILNMFEDYDRYRVG